VKAKSIDQHVIVTREEKGSWEEEEEKKAGTRGRSRVVGAGLCFTQSRSDTRF